MKKIFVLFSLLTFFCNYPRIYAGGESAADLVKKGRQLQTEKKYDEAANAYKEALKLDPKNAVALSNLGLVYAEVETSGGPDKKKEAIECYDKFLEITPNDSYVLTRKGELLQMQGKLDEANACFDGAIKADPKSCEPLYLKGEQLSGQSKFEEAIKFYDKALELEPKFMNCWCSKGKAFLNLKKYDEAIECCDKAISLEPGFDYPKEIREEAIAAKAKR